MTVSGLPNDRPSSALSSPGVQALVVGTSSHVPGSALPDVPSVADTVLDLADTLVERCGLRPENLYGGGPLIDPPNLAVLGDALTNAAALATDLLLVYYVGHGLVDLDNELYLATWETDDPVRRLAYKALSYKAVRDALVECSAQSIIVVLDCCFAGRAYGTYDPAASAFELAAFGGTYLLMSSSRDERSLALPGERHTAFTGELLKLLRDGDPGGLPALTLEHVYEHLCRILPQRGAPAPRRQLSGRMGTLVLAPNPAAGSVPTMRPPHAAEARVDEVDVPCPYRGLAPFTADDARFFFGREAQTAELSAKVMSWAGESGPIAVVGPSGSGKSSLLLAGFLPTVRRGDLRMRGPQAWSSLTLTPEAEPLRRLARRLAKPAGTTEDELVESLRADPSRLDTVIRQSLRQQAEEHGGAERRLLILVDQFEELFTACTDEDERRAFVQALCAASTRTDDATPPPAVVVLVVRADFYALCMDYPELVAAFRERQVPVDAMRPGQLRDAIEKPAAEAGLLLEEGLTEMLLRDVGADRDDFSAGTLPLLSYALQRTWGNRDGRTLTLSGYQASGGVWQAVTQGADRVYADLDRWPGGQQAARALLLRMVHIGEGTEDTRRHVELTALLAERPDPADRSALVAARDALADARLITVEGDSAQIAHEALIRAWPRLRLWIKENRSGLLLHQQLTDTSAEWQRTDRHESLLYRGPKLAAARQWFAEPDNASTLGPLERRFLTTSTHAHRRRNWEKVGVAALLVIALVAGAVGIWQYRNATARQDVIASRQIALRADALRTGDPATALQLSLAAYRIAPTLEARSSLMASYATPYPTVLPAHDGRIVDIKSTSDRGTLASSGVDTKIRLWDVTDPLHPTRRAELETDAPAMMSISPDSRLLAAQSKHSFYLWDLTDPGDPTALARLDSPTTPRPSIVFSPDGTTVVTSGAAGTVQMWDITVPSHPEMTTLPVEGDTVAAVAFSPVGRILATGSAATGAGRGTTNVRLWDLANPHTPGLLATRSVDSALSLAFNPQANLLVAAGVIDSIDVWDVTNPRDPTARDVRTFTAEGNGDYRSVAFAPDGRTFFTAKSTGTVDQWEIADDQIAVYATLPGTPSVFAVALIPGDPVVASGSEDGAVRLWTSPRPVLPRSRIHEPGPGTAFSDDGRVFAASSATDDDPVRLWDVTDPFHPAEATVLPRPWVRAAFLPNGRTLISQSRDRASLALWDAEDPHHPTLAATFAGQGGVRSTSDAHLLALEERSNQRVAVWDISDSHHPTMAATIPARAEAEVSEVRTAFLGNTTLLVYDDDGVRLWDLTDVRHPMQVATLPIDRALGGVLYNSHTHLLNLWVHSGSVTMWDLSDVRNPRQFEKGGIVANVKGIDFIDDRTMAVVTANDGKVGLWDVADPNTPRLVASVPADSAVDHLIIDQKSRTLAQYTGQSATVHLWDVGDPRDPVDLGTVPGPGDNLEFSPDGQTIATQGTGPVLGAEVPLMNYRPDAVYKHLCSVTPQKITPEQWDRNVGNLHSYQNPCDE